MAANKAAHDAALRAIRGGGSDALTSDAGAITLNVFPLIEGVLRSLQDAGLISADRNIPDLSGFEPSADRIAKLEALLGRDLPDDIGTITLVESERLGDVQTVIRWFDLETGVLLLLAVLFVALALWLSSRRIRMVLWLSVGAIGALLIARVLVRLTLEAVTRRQEEPGARVLVDAIIDASLDSLLWFTFVLMAIAAVVAIAAWYVEGREDRSRTSDVTPPQTRRHWVRDNMAPILMVGLGLIVIVALWSVSGPDVALVTAAAIGILLVGVKVAAGGDDDSPAPDHPGG